jgi:GNAT superfamily N-acetyltransferase
MEIKKEDIKADGIKYILEKDGQKVGHAFLYLMKNELHDKPFGLIEDVFINEEHRGKGLGTMMLERIISDAKAQCYKIILTSRYSKPKVHALYENFGFKDWGKEFRMDIN